MRDALKEIALARIAHRGARYLIELKNPAELETALRRLQQVFGISHLAVARPVNWSHKTFGQVTAGDDVVPQICETAWDEIRTESFSTFAVRAKRSAKRFPHNSMFLELE